MEDGDESVGLSPLNGTENNVRRNWGKDINAISANHFLHSPSGAIHCDYLALSDAGAAETMTVPCLTDRIIAYLGFFCVWLRHLT